MEKELTAALVVFLSSSVGFWAWLIAKFKKKDEKEEAFIALVMGMAQNKIVCLGLEYIERGSITYAEYQDLHKYLFTPYKSLGGNGTAERVMHAVERLPFQTGTLLDSITELPIRHTDDPERFIEDLIPYEGEDRRERRSP